jgi:ATP-dependent DNA helicase RecQ
MSKEARDANQNAFMTEPMIMVATIAFGMGIDKPDVAFVFHTDLPGSVEAYYQEIGRSGRDGRPAEAHMLYGLSDIRMRRMFIDNEDTSAEHKRRSHQRLDALIGYCEAAQCRRQILLHYFGEASERCGNCDNCLSEAPCADGTAEAQLVLAAVAQSGNRFGPSYIIDILRGHETQKVVANGHDRLASFGSGKARPKDAWQSLIRQLVVGGFLKQDLSGHGGMAIAEKGRALGRGEVVFEYRVEAPRNARDKVRPAQESGPRTDADPALLGVLKTLRLKLASERRVPAYVIFSDRALIDMAERCPRDLDAFAAVHGVGAAKLKNFGRIFLDAIAAYQAGTGS